jgi:5-methylcytosine-specific restriction endonuclease McrA
VKCPFCIKVCTKCGRLLVAYSGNFRKAKKGKWGLYASCKRCEKQYYEEHKEQIAEKSKQYYEENKEYYAEKSKQYYEENKEYYAEYMKQYYEENKEQIAERNKQYREENKEQIAEHMKQYREENPHIQFNAHNRRRSKEENQGNGVSKEQWLEMMIFFDFKCAYSGEKLSSKKVRTVDHIVALDNGGLNEVWNCVPMYRNYNTSKHTKDMEQWYRQQKYFSEERLEKIYQWIEYAYEKWGKEN